jgi:multidrug transporter EmrE-like cation transporter
MVYVLLVLNIILLVTGQTLWKIGLDRLGGMQLQNWIAVLLSPYIMGGIVLYGLATVLWLAVLSRLPLSLAYPLQSIAYIAGLLVAFYLFREAVPLNRWLGAGVIMAGIIILSWK